MTTRPRGSSAGRWAELALVLFVAVVGIAIGRVTAAPGDAGEPSAREAPAARPTEAGAVAAALDYLDTLRWDVLVDDARRRSAIKQRAVPEAVDELDASLATAAQPLGAAVTVAPVVARPAPLGYRVEHFDDERARVSVWGMVLFATGAHEPVTQWATSRIDLVWRSSRWLVSSVRSRGGPSPESGLDELATATRRFKEVRRAP